MAKQAKTETPDVEGQHTLPIHAPRRQRDRAGKRNISGQFDAQIAKALKTLAIREDRTLYSLLGEAIDDVLQKYGQEIESR